MGWVWGPDDLEGRSSLEGLALSRRGEDIEVRGLSDDSRGGHEGGEDGELHFEFGIESDETGKSVIMKCEREELKRWNEWMNE